MSYRKYQAAAGDAPVMGGAGAYGVSFGSANVAMGWKPSIATFNRAHYRESKYTYFPLWGETGELEGAYSSGFVGCQAIMLGASRAGQNGQPPFALYYYRHNYSNMDEFPNAGDFARMTTPADTRAVVAANSKYDARHIADYLLAALAQGNGSDGQPFILPSQNVLLYYLCPGGGDIDRMAMNFEHGTFGHFR